MYSKNVLKINEYRLTYNLISIQPSLFSNVMIRIKLHQL
jgi:hypothetical protein